jgi:hypothetical protein
MPLLEGSRPAFRTWEEIKAWSNYYVDSKKFQKKSFQFFFGFFRIFRAILREYGTHHSYVLVVHTLRVAENEILAILSILCLMLVSLEFIVAAPEPFLCINSLALCP